MMYDIYNKPRLPAVYSVGQFRHYRHDTSLAEIADATDSSVMWEAKKIAVTREGAKHTTTISKT